MKRADILKNIICYFLIFLFAFIFVVFGYNLAKMNEERSFSLTVKCGNETEELKFWQYKQKKEWYIFLPSDTEQVFFPGEQGVQITGLESDKWINVDETVLKTAYKANISERNESVSFLRSSNIPALFISTKSGSMDKINANKKNHESGNFHIVSSNKTISQSGTIKSFHGRGNTSWQGSEKKGYTMEMEDSHSLLGLKKSSKYVLIANSGNNYLSNSIAFWLEKQVGLPNATDAVFVDLYLNGEYAGNYILCEKIQVGNAGIQITDLEEKNEKANDGQKLGKLKEIRDKDGKYKAFIWKNEPEDITGGYLLERDVPEYYEKEKSGFIANSGDRYVVKSPKYVSIKEVRYIKNYIDRFYSAVSSEDGYNEEGVYYKEYIDANSFALKYTLEEFLNFKDAGRSSAYYYKDADGVLFSGPGWDYGGAFLGNYDSFTKLNSTAYSTELFVNLLKHDDFFNLAVDSYVKSVRPRALDLAEWKIDEMSQEILQSAKMDELRWGRNGFSDDCAEIKNWIIKRIEFLDWILLSEQPICTVAFRENEWAEKSYVYVKKGEYLKPDDIPHFLDGSIEILGWINDETGEKIDFSLPVTSDIDAVAYGNQATAGLGERLIEYAGKLWLEIVFGVAVFVILIAYYIRKIKRGY